MYPTPQVCEDAGVELENVPLTTQYWDRVVSHSVSEIREGRTPNPDMLCNSRVKFGAWVLNTLMCHHLMLMLSQLDLIIC